MNIVKTIWITQDITMSPSFYSKTYFPNVSTVPMFWPTHPNPHGKWRHNSHVFPCAHMDYHAAY